MGEPFVSKSDKRLHLTSWEEEIPGLIAGFTTKNGGVSKGAYQFLNMGLHVSDNEKNVIQNRELLGKELNIPLHQWVSGEQVHGTSVYRISASDLGKGSTSHDTAIQGVDGLIMEPRQKGLAIAFFADCVPLLFVDPTTNLAGIAHAGWKGTVGRIAETMVKELVQAGASINTLKVAIGPCISKQNYQVDDFVLSHLSEEAKQNCTESVSKGQYLLDLKQLNVDILVHSGVIRHNIDSTNYCTFQDEHLFFSHRRDKGKTGRMLGFIGFLDKS